MCTAHCGQPDNLPAIDDRVTPAMFLSHAVNHCLHTLLVGPRLCSAGLFEKRHHAIALAPGRRAPLRLLGFAAEMGCNLSCRRLVRAMTQHALSLVRRLPTFVVRSYLGLRVGAGLFSHHSCCKIAASPPCFHTWTSSRCQFSAPEWKPCQTCASASRWKTSTWS